VTDPVDYARQLVEDWWHARCTILDDNPAHGFNPNLRRVFHDEPLGWQHARNPLQLFDDSAWCVLAASILTWRTSRPKAEPILRRLLMLGAARVATFTPLRLETELRPAGQIKRRPRWIRAAAKLVVKTDDDPADCEVEQLAPQPDVTVDWIIYRLGRETMPINRQQARTLLIRGLAGE
jgi:hypothetical protein